MIDEPILRALEAHDTEARLGELAHLLVDAVARGASVNFMAGFSHEQSVAFWRAQLPGIAAGTTRLIVAELDKALIGTVLLTFALQPNGPHRADVGKMLVHSSVRRRGLGRRLLAAVESEALAAGRTLLVLDTEAGSAGDHLYRAGGWREVGTVPGHSLTPDGRLADATIFCKRLA